MGAEVNLFVYAKKAVANKTVAQRIAHSPALHGVRSAFSSGGSFVSKGANLLGAAGRVAMGLIPIPALPAISATFEKHFEGFLRGKAHEKRLEAAKAQGNVEDTVKFELKELSLEEMDRYRWKVHQAMTDLNNALQSHNDKLAKASQEQARCAAYVELATASEQAARRILKLYHKCFVVKGIMEETMDWLEDISLGSDGKGGVVERKRDIKKNLKIEIDEYKKLPGDRQQLYIDAYHTHCAGWCWAKDLSKPPSATPKLDFCANVLKWLAEPAFEALEDIGREQVGEHRDQILKKSA